MRRRKPPFLSLLTPDPGANHPNFQHLILKYNKAKDRYEFEIDLRW